MNGEPVLVTARVREREKRKKIKKTLGLRDKGRKFRVEKGRRGGLRRDREVREGRRKGRVLGEAFTPI